MQPARPIRRRPGQRERRAEILVVRIHMIRLEEVVRVEARKGRIAQRIYHLPEILIAKSQRQAEGRRRQPGVLEKVSLVELIGMNNSRVKILSPTTGRPAEVVEEVGESR